MGEAFVITEHRAGLAGPALEQHKIAADFLAWCPREDGAVGLHQRRLNAEERPGCAAGLQRRGTGQRRDQRAAGFGLPPRIDDGQLLLADDPVIPVPRLRIDRFANRAEQPQARQIMAVHRLITIPHDGAQGGGRGVEDVDLMLVDHLPEAVVGREAGDAFEHQHGGPGGQRAIDDVTVAGDPADIGRAPECFAGAIIEHGFKGEIGPQQIAGGGVEHALGFAGGAAGVEDEQRIFGVHRFRSAGVRHLGADVVPPVIAVFHHGDAAAGVADDQHGFDVDAGDLGLIAGLVGDGFQRDGLATASAFVGGDDEAALRVFDAAGEAFGREAAEHHRVNGADARTGQHGHRGFRDHRHVDGDAVALVDTQRHQCIGHARHLFAQLAIADAAAFSLGIVGFPDDGGALGVGVGPAVEAVPAGVDHTIFEPLDLHRVPAPVAHGGGRLVPIEPPDLVAPEAIGIGEALRVKRMILLRRGAGDGEGLWGDGVHAHARQTRPQRRLPLEAVHGLSPLQSDGMRAR